MSSRQLRKLQKQKEQEEKLTQEAEPSDDYEEPRIESPKPRSNLFAALGGSEDDDDAIEVDEDEDATMQDAQQEINEAPAPAEKKKSKKKKKNKSKTAAIVGGEEDEIDKAIKELGISSKTVEDPSATTSTSGASQGINRLLKINSYHLKLSHEMRNLFGREIMESANAEEEQETNRQTSNRLTHVDLETFLREPPGAKGLSEVTLRRNIFIQGKEHWPQASVDGLTMTEVGPTQNGSGTEYTYACAGEYNKSQHRFFGLVLMGEPMELVMHLKKAPYHVSTLIQVSNVAIQDQNMALSAELLERALFTLGRVTTSSFRQDLEEGKARLDFKRPENRQLWLAGYHYIRSLIRKGTYRTALEWAKLLFAIEPQDPYAMRHFIQFLAMKSHEASWLLEFLSELVKGNHNGDVAYLQQTRVPALLQTGNVEQARQELVEGMKRLPWLYCVLFQKLNLDTPPSIWGINADSDARAFWTGLYLSGGQDAWNNDQAKKLLLDVAKSLSRVNVAILPSDDPPIDRGSVRFAMLEGQRTLLAVAPQELTNSDPNFDFDPLPPPRAENIFQSSGFERSFPGLRGPSTSEQRRELIMPELQRLLTPLDGETATGASPQPIDMGPEDTTSPLLQRIMNILNIPGLRTQDIGLHLGNEGDETNVSERGEAEGLPGAWPEEPEESRGSHGGDEGGER